MSRLYKKLVYEKQIAQNVNAYQYSTMLGSVFGIEATARPGHTLKEIEAVIDEELELLRTKGPAAAEVDRARNVLETQIFNGLQLVGGFGGVADQLNLYNHYVGTPDYLAQDMARRRRVTPESVRQFAQRYLAPNASVVVHGVPGKQILAPEVPKPAEQAATGAAQTTSMNADEPWRTKQPGAAAARTVRVPVPQSFELPNGLTVIALPQTGGVPVVSASLVLRSGSDANPLEKPGLAELHRGRCSIKARRRATRTARRRGGADRRVARAPARHGMRRRCRRAASAGIFRPRCRLSPTSRFVRAFPAEEVERVRATRLANLVEQRGNPVQIVGNVTGKTLYGTHQYGFSETGTVESNKQLTRDDLQAFWRQHFVPGNAALVVTGAITVPELSKLAETAFGSVAARHGRARQARRAHRRRRRASSSSIVPGSPQTQLRVATFGVPRSSPDYVPVRVMNTILGGMFASRINMNLREEHGYTYGANSQFAYWRSGGPFSVATGVRTDVTAPAVHEVMLELKKMSETRVTPAGADAREGRDYAAVAGAVRNQRSDDGEPVDALHARPAAELLLESVRADLGRRRAGRAGRREEISGAGQVRGRGSRRPLEDRRRPRERARNAGRNQGRGRGAHKQVRSSGGAVLERLRTSRTSTQNQNPAPRTQNLEPI